MLTEIRNDYICESISSEEGELIAYGTVDGWEDDNDQGFVIATVGLSKHGDIFTVFHHNGYRMNKAVIMAANGIKKRLNVIYILHIGVEYASISPVEDFWSLTIRAKGREEYLEMPDVHSLAEMQKRVEEMFPINGWNSPLEGSGVKIWEVLL